MRRPATRRRKAPPPRPYPVPLPCVLVAVDPGRTSGWAIYHEGRPVTWGSLDAADVSAIDRVLLEACELASRTKRPLVVLAEEWGTGGARGMAQWQGLGAAWGSWRFACDRARGKGLPVVEDRVMRVHVSKWRAAFGLASLRKEHAKAYALRAVHERLGIELAPELHDVAEALLIGLWGARAGEVGAKLPKRAMEAAGLLRRTA